MRGPSNPRTTQVMTKGRILSLPLLAPRRLGGFLFCWLLLCFYISALLLDSLRAISNLFCNKWRCVGRSLSCCSENTKEPGQNLILNAYSMFSAPLKSPPSFIFSILSFPTRLLLTIFLSTLPIFKPATSAMNSHNILSASTLFLVRA